MNSCSLTDKVLEMAGKELCAIENIDETSFGEFFRSRIVQTVATTKPRYAAKVLAKTLMLPLYYAAYNLYLLRELIPEDR